MISLLKGKNDISVFREILASLRDVRLLYDVGALGFTRCLRRDACDEGRSAPEWLEDDVAMDTSSMLASDKLSWCAHGDRGQGSECCLVKKLRQEKPSGRKPGGGKRVQTQSFASRNRVW